MTHAHDVTEATTGPQPRLRDCARTLLARAVEVVGQGWCRHEEALDGQARPCSAADDDAVQWSAGGAIRRAASDALSGLTPGLSGVSAARISAAYGLAVEAAGRIADPQQRFAQAALRRWNDQQREVSRVQGLFLAAAALLGERERKVA